MNEILFFTHIFVVLVITIFASRRGVALIISLISIQAVLANIFVLKQTELFGLSVTCSDVFAVGGVIGLNLLQEYHGKKWANQAILASFFCLVFFALMSEMHLLYQPHSLDQTQSAFETIFSSSFRISLSSLVVFFGMQKLDVFLFGRFQRKFQHRYLPLRVVLSLLITQGLDTVLFSFIGLYGVVASIKDVIILSLLIKGVIILCSGSIIAFVKTIFGERRDVPL